MSHQAIAAVLAREDLASGERLVALSLASFADRGNCAWPGAAAAAARAGLGRSRYLDARERLVASGLVVVDQRATGRGRSSVVSLPFADVGPWWEGAINVELLDAVLGRSGARGPARLLLATMAAIADADGVVRDISTEQLRAAAGVADRTYRRARTRLLASGELVLVSGAGGRGNTNIWSVPDPRSAERVAVHRARTRVAPPVGARPLAATVVAPESATSSVDPAPVASAKGGHDRALVCGNRRDLTSVSGRKEGHDRTVPAENDPVLAGVSAAKGGQGWTLFELSPAETPAETPAKTPAETPAPNARAGRKSQNPRTPKDPPSPPWHERSSGSMLIEESYVTDRGRRRSRRVRVDLEAVRRGLRLPTTNHREDWERIHQLLGETVGESTFAIWLLATAAVRSSAHEVRSPPGA